MTVIVTNDEAAPEATPVVEEAAAAVVEVAEIEADRDIRLAEIAAETEEARIEVMAEAVAETAPTVNLEEGLSECQQNIASLTETLSTELGLIRQLLEERAPPLPPPPSGEAVLPVEEPPVEAPPAPKPKAPPYKLI
jgi:hypothetical protein